MRIEKTLFKIGSIEVKVTSIRPDESFYKIPKFFHNRICNWFDIYGIKYKDKVYYFTKNII